MSFEDEMRLHYLAVSVDDTFMCFPADVRDMLYEFHPFLEGGWIARGAYARWHKYGAPPVQLAQGWHNRALDTLWNTLLEQVDISAIPTKDREYVFDVCVSLAEIQDKHSRTMRRSNMDFVSKRLPTHTLRRCFLLLSHSGYGNGRKPYDDLASLYAEHFELSREDAVRHVLQIVLQSEGISL
jgi:hypothetical protein